MFKFLFIIVACAFFSLCHATESEFEDEAEFSYREGSGKGPEDWGSLKPQWRACGSGKMQSPIHLLRADSLLKTCLGRLRRDYRPAPATLRNRGHDITLEWKGDAGKISINDTDYNLKRGHWHSPSEHMINGSRYDLEFHIIHESCEGKIAVLAILYKYGRPNPFLAKLLRHVKSVQEEEEEKSVGIVDLGKSKFGNRMYYRYMGSLTTPPCSEGIVWTISHKVRTVSRKQVRALRSAVHDGFENNARPIQHRNGREIWLHSTEDSGCN